MKRSAQTVLGAAWAVVQPLLTIVTFTVIFGRFARIPSDGLPYSVFSLVALVPHRAPAAADPHRRVPDHAIDRLTAARAGALRLTDQS